MPWRKTLLPRLWQSRCRCPIWRLRDHRRNTRRCPARIAAFEQNVFSDAAIDIPTLERCVSCLGNFRSTSGRGDLDAGAVHRRRRRDKLSADQKFAFETLKVDATPTFFINGEKLKGAMSFEEIDKKIKSLLKR